MSVLGSWLLLICLIVPLWIICAAMTINQRKKYWEAERDRLQANLYHERESDR